VTFFEIPGDVLPEQLPDGHFKCRRCGHVWYPSLDGRLEPTLASLRCPQCPAVRPATPLRDTTRGHHARGGT